MKRLFFLLKFSFFRPPHLEPERKGQFQAFFGGKFCHQFYFVMKMENLITNPHAKWLLIKWNFRAAMPPLPWLKKH